MKARDLLHRDPTFTALIQCWADEKQCPLGLADYLLEVGLGGQAEGARWAATKGKRAGTNFTPTDAKHPFPEELTEKESHYYWFVPRYESGMDCWHNELPEYLIPDEDSRDLWYYSDANSLPLLESLCVPLDLWADYFNRVKETPDGTGSDRAGEQHRGVRGAAAGL